jgi:hypothetical protein
MKIENVKVEIYRASMLPEDWNVESEYVLRFINTTNGYDLEDEVGEIFPKLVRQLAVLGIYDAGNGVMECDDKSMMPEEIEKHMIDFGFQTEIMDKWEEPEDE